MGLGSSASHWTCCPSCCCCCWWGGGGWGRGAPPRARNTQHVLHSKGLVLQSGSCVVRARELAPVVAAATLWKAPTNQASFGVCVCVCDPTSGVCRHRSACVCVSGLRSTSGVCLSSFGSPEQETPEQETPGLCGTALTPTSCRTPRLFWNPQNSRA